jgi:hypothetical protein
MIKKNALVLQQTYKVSVSDYKKYINLTNLDL